MSFPAAPGNDIAHTEKEELVLTMMNGVVTKIERLDNITHARKELSNDEYAAITTSYYAMYYAGIRDYAQAMALDDATVAEAYHQAMTAFFASVGET